MLLGLFTLFLILAVVVLFALPVPLVVGLVLLAVWLCWRRKRLELVMLLGSLLVAFGCLEVFVRLAADDIFYREHERYALKRRYRPNVDAQVQVRFGDLVAMNPVLEKTLAHPRTIRFKTDGRGYRNAHDYANEPYIMLGDSFITTVGMTQEDILGSQLNAAMPEHFYSLGFPGTPDRYEGAARVFLDKASPQARFIWFIYEGNDFEPTGVPYTLKPPPDPGSDLRYYMTIRILPFMATRVLTIFYRAVGARVDVLQGEPPLVVRTFPLAGQDIGFFEEDMQNAGRPDVELRSWGTQEIMSRTACVFFIPDKYRVYKPWISEGPSVSEPPAGLTALHRFFGAYSIPVVDLTPALQRAAKEHLAHDELVYWPDDTHWNTEGIKSVVPDITRCVGSDKARK